MLAGVRNILIIVNKGQLGQFRKLLPENNLGIKIEYKEQIELKASRKLLQSVKDS